MARLFCRCGSCPSTSRKRERHADGLLTDDGLVLARLRAEESAARAWALWDDGTAQAQEAAAAAAGPNPEAAATKASEYAAAAAQAESGGEPAAWKSEQRRQSGLLRDLFGDPWAAPAVPDPAWLAWGGGTVLAVARSAYESGRFQDLPVLADALEDAGCDDERLLGHLRQQGPHARDCWALGVILGLE
jgi:hypothetical protein